jgi:hypothetical protein
VNSFLASFSYLALFWFFGEIPLIALPEIPPSDFAPPLALMFWIALYGH